MIQIKTFSDEIMLNRWLEARNGIIIRKITPLLLGGNEDNGYSLLYVVEFEISK